MAIALELAQHNRFLRRRRIEVLRTFFVHRVCDQFAFDDERPRGFGSDRGRLLLRPVRSSQNGRTSMPMRVRSLVGLDCRCFAVETLSADRYSSGCRTSNGASSGSSRIGRSSAGTWRAWHASGMESSGVCSPFIDSRTPPTTFAQIHVGRSRILECERYSLALANTINRPSRSRSTIDGQRLSASPTIPAESHERASSVVTPIGAVRFGCR